jgi:hypothetical protein
MNTERAAADSPVEPVQKARRHAPGTTLVARGEPISAYPGWDAARGVFSICRDDEASSSYADVEAEVAAAAPGAPPKRRRSVRPAALHDSLGGGGARRPSGTGRR